MDKKCWYIQEGLYFSELSGNVFTLNYNADDTIILLAIEDVDDIIDILKQIKVYYKTGELKKIEKEAMARWGKEKTPAETDFSPLRQSVRDVIE
jgi:hypothetical protein